ncbi:hypothetical protein [Pectinatus frisingensis]|uniref:hypothetical protein n=1 Tax=Pectinatus frisingensis TaxID=865 RepID=UPI0018C5ECB2|nr:hypothetical protein [Pectinatus frisingensis]
MNKLDFLFKFLKKQTPKEKELSNTHEMKLPTKKVNIKNNQRIINIIGIVILLLLLFYIYTLFFPKQSTQQLPKSTNPQKTVQTKKDTTALVANSMQLNPFIELNQLKKTESAPNTNVTRNNAPLPAIPAMSTGNIPLPSIPSMPSLSNGIGLPSAEPAKPQKQQATVQGVLTGNDGKNVAIMTDGTVLSAGDTYNDNRVAYIGGDGVEFDNGNTLQYK